MVVDVDSKKIIFDEHGYGFFSNCNEILRSTINTCLYHNFLFELEIPNGWSLYKDEQNESIYTKFFKPNEIIFEIEKDTFLVEGQGDQYSNYKLINYKFVTPFVKKYFSLSDEVLSIVKELEDKYNINYENTIAVLYRGNNKITETELPSYEVIDNKLNEIKLKFPNHKIIIQSDEQEFCDFMLKHENSFVFDESLKINCSPSAHITQIIPQGFRVKNAQIFLAIMSIISKCKVVVLNSGNVGMWVCLFRGNAKNIYQYLNYQMISGKWTD